MTSPRTETPGPGPPQPVAASACGGRLSWAGLGLLLAVSCQQAAPVTPPVDVRRAVAALVDGLGASRVCQGDQDCEGGGQRGACVLGTCCGLLTTDQRPARRVLVERLAHTEGTVRTAAESRLLEALEAPTSGASARIAAVEGLGSLQASGFAADCPVVCKALRRAMDDPDGRVAATARVALGTLGDALAVPGLLEDAATGTELLRAEALRGLAGLRGTPSEADAREALLKAVDDASPVVQLAAVRALRPWSHDADVVKRLTALAAGRAPQLIYTVDRQTEGAR